MTTDDARMRAAFEAWCNSKPSGLLFSLKRMAYGNGLNIEFPADYESPRAEYAWMGYRAALADAQAAEPSALDRLAESQTRLDPGMAKVLQDNAWDLYEIDAKEKEGTEMTIHFDESQVVTCFGHIVNGVPGPITIAGPSGPVESKVLPPVYDNLVEANEALGVVQSTIAVEPSAAVRAALQQIVEADDAHALTQQLIEIGRAALAAAPAASVAEQVDLCVIRKWPDGFEKRLQHVWLDVVSFIPDVKLYDLQRVLAEFGFRMEVYEDSPADKRARAQESGE